MMVYEDITSLCLPSLQSSSPDTLDPCSSTSHTVQVLYTQSSILLTRYFTSLQFYLKHSTCTVYTVFNPPHQILYILVVLPHTQYRYFIPLGVLDRLLNPNVFKISFPQGASQRVLVGLQSPKLVFVSTFLNYLEQIMTSTPTVPHRTFCMF